MFITFEGVEGSGKSTAMKAIAAWLKEQGRDVLCTREPGGTALGATLRTLMLDTRNKNITPGAELFLYLADRSQHVAEVIRPALKEGKVVLSDRYADSTIVYQGYGRGFLPQELHKLNDVAVDGLWPDRTLVFDVDPAVGLVRARSRNTLEGTALSEGRFEEEELAFHERVRQGFLQWAARYPKRFRVIDSGADLESVLAQSKEALHDVPEQAS